MAFDEVEAELRRHPKIRDCVVTEVRIDRSRDMVVAYVETTERIEPAEVRDFLTSPRLRISDVPRAVIRVNKLPRTKSGRIDRESLPQPPVQPGRLAGLKVPGNLYGDSTFWALILFPTVIFGLLAYLMTDVIWPGSTDLSIVPQPYAFLFNVLYIIECLAFGLGIGFLIMGRKPLLRVGRPRGLTTLTHLAIVWLLISWWLQDNSYRLTAKTDWNSQAWLVYVFNVTLMGAAAVVAVFATRNRLRD
ncbi:hypothetical protein ACFQ1S_10695 [Kibdelosporangium lantanae]|uniref:AMP-binding enzyme C-terminal domain-containing protein n=1 Tax=Kibdelosporangium lantanae TaxID=1497396 RepID=A0ABW3M5U0_9PSEU